VKLISLIGEQPIPILLASLYLEPDQNLLVHTDHTREVAERLTKLLPDSKQLSVDAYEFDAIREDLGKELKREQAYAINITGGTKMMSLAAYSLASEHQNPFYYLKSETKESILYAYDFEEGALRSRPPQVLPELLNISQYLLAHLPGYREKGAHREGGKISLGGAFERALAETLQKEFDEVLVGVKPEGVAEQIDLDLVIRKGNQVGIIEAKTSASHRPKEGIDQITTAAARKYLGTYTHRFYVVGNLPKDRRFQELAQQNHIQVIFLPGYSHRDLPGNDARRLVARILEKMNPEKHA
jgi:hypothetical protein